MRFVLMFLCLLPALLPAPAPASLNDCIDATCRITLPDGSQRSLPAGATATTLAESIGSRLARAAVAAVVDGDERDLGAPLRDGSTVAIVTADSDAGRHVLRHSTAHVMAQAVTRLFPGAKYSIGPAIENGVLLVHGEHIAAVGAEVDDPVGGLDDVEVVLDDEHRVAAVHEAMEHFEEHAHVLEVQARRGFVEDVQRAARVALGE